MTAYRRRPLKTLARRGVLLGGSALCGAAWVALAGQAKALPTLPTAQIPGGGAPPTYTTSGRTGTVTLNNGRTLIDWKSFDVGFGETLNFNFGAGHGDWIVLNRLGGSADIEGAINGFLGDPALIGGNIWLFAPGGILIGNHASINAGGLLLSTANVTPGQANSFLNSGSATDFSFGDASATGSILVKAGASLRTYGGALAMVSPEVITEAGSRVKADGSVLYVAADAYRIRFDDQGGALELFDFIVPKDEADAQGSVHRIALAGSTEGANVYVAAVSRTGVIDALVGEPAVVPATTAETSGGTLVLSGARPPKLANGLSGEPAQVGFGAGGGPSEVTISGSIVAHGSGGKGGDILVTGDEITLKSGSLLDASGAAGGLVLVGGDIHGGADPSQNFYSKPLDTASTTTVEKGATILADGTAGKGGNVVVWSNDHTQFAGQISGTGNGGDGGFAEVSGKQTLDYTGFTDLRSTGAAPGNLLLDPLTVTISTSADSSTSSTSNINNGTLSTELGAENVTVSSTGSGGGSGDITTTAPVTWSSGYTLSLEAARNISFTGAGALQSTAGPHGNGDISLSTTGGSITLGDGSTSPVISTAGTLTVSATGAITQSAALSVGGASSFSTGAGAITLTNSSNAFSGAVTLSNSGSNDIQISNAAGDVLILGAVTAGGALTVTAPTGITLTGNVTSGGGQTYNNPVTLGADVGVESTGGATITFSSTVDSDATARTLLVASGFPGAGAVNFDGVIGATHALAGLGVLGSSASFTNSGSGNDVGTLAVNVSSGGITFKNSAALTIGTVSVTGLLFEVGGLSATGQTVSLTSAGAISQTANDIISAGTLTGSSATGTTLTQGNQITNLGGFSNSTSGDIQISNAQALDVTGAVSNSATAGVVTLKTTSGALSIGASPSALGLVTLTGASGIDLNTNISTTGGVDFTSAVTLGGDTTVASTGSGDITFGSTLDSDTTARALTVNTAGTTTFAGAVGGINPLASLTTDAAGSTTINANVSTSSTQTYNDAVTAAGGVTLTTGNANLTFAKSLTGSGNLTLDAGTATLDVVGAFSVAGNLSETAGTFADNALAPSLTGTTSGWSIDKSSGGLDLHTVAVSAPGDVSITAGGGGTLTTGVVTSTKGDVTLATTGGGALTLDGDVTTSAANHTVNLNSSGTILQSAGKIATDTLTGTSAGGATLTSTTNSFSNLKGFTNTGAGGISITDDPDLTVTANMNSGTGDLTLTTTAGNSIILEANLTAGTAGGTQAVILNSGNLIQQSSGIITAGRLTGSSTGSTTLNDANQIGALGALTAGSGFSLKDAYTGGLVINDGTSVSETVGAGTGDLTLTVTGGNLQIGANATHAGVLTAGTAGGTQHVFFDVAGNITETDGSITTGILAGTGTTGGSSGSTALASATNQIGTLGAFAAGAGLALTDAHALVVAGNVSGGTGDLSLTTTGAGNGITIDPSVTVDDSGHVLTLDSAGAIGEDTTAVLKAATFTGGAAGHGSVGGATLTGANQVTNLGAFTNSSSGGFSFSNAGALNVSGVVANTAASGAVSIATTSGVLTVSASPTALGLLTFTGAGGIALDTSVSTSGGVSFQSPVTLDTDATVASSSSGAVTFATTVNSDSAATPRNLTVDTAGTTTFGDAVGGTFKLASVTTDAAGTTAINGGAITTTGAQTYNDAVTLGADTTLTGTSPTFGSTVTGNNHDLALNFSGTTTINGADFTGIKNLSTGNGGATDLLGTITTSGSQTYGDAVVLTADATTASTGSAAVDFASTVDGSHALTVNTAGVTTFGGAVGGTTALTSLTTDAAGSTDLNGGSVKTTGAQTYNDAVTLGATTTLTSTASGNITLGSTVDGAFGLTVDTAGTTTFGGPVGGTTALTSLTTDAAGSTDLNGGSVKTAGAQAYNDAVTLGATTTLTSTASGNITLGSTVDGAFGLTVDTAGTTTFGGPVGGTTALTSLTTDAAGSTDLNGGSVKTTGAQTYDDAVTLGATTTLTSTASGNITLGSTVDGTFGLTVDTAGTTTFGGPVGGAIPLSSLTTDAAGATAINTTAITTTGPQTYNDAVTLGSGVVLTSTAAGNITFGSTLDGPFALTVATDGTTAFDGLVGQGTELASLTTQGSTTASSGITAINTAAISTSGDQTYRNAVTLGADATLTGATPTFGSTVAGAGHDLTLNFTGTTLIDGARFTGIRNLATGNGGLTQLTGNITTSGAQAYHDVVTLTGATALASTGGGNVTFFSTVDSDATPRALSVDSAGATTFDGAVGAANPLASLTLVTEPGATTTLNGGSVDTTGPQTYGDPVLLGADTAITAAGPVAFGSTIDSTGSAGTLTIAAGANNVTFSGAIGAGGALNGLGIKAGDVSFAAADNDVATLAVNLTGSAGFTFRNATNLAVGSIGSFASGISTANGPVALITHGSGALSLVAPVNIGTAMLTLASAGPISQTSSGPITAGTLTGQSSGGATLTAANLVADLGNFANSGGGNLTFQNAQALSVTGTVSNTGGGALAISTSGTGAVLTIASTALVSDTAGPVALTTSGAGSNLSIAGTVDGSGQTLTLDSSGTLAETGSGLVKAATLTGQSAGGATLTGANQVANLANFANSGSGGIDFHDNQAFQLTGAVSASGQTVNLVSTGAITQTPASVITAGTLTGQSSGGAALTGANLVVNLGDLANSGGGDLSFHDAQALNVTGTVSNTGGGALAISTSGNGAVLTIASTGLVSDTAGPVALTTSGAGSNLSIAGTVDASGQTLTLDSSGTLDESGGTGTVKALALTGGATGHGSVGGATLDSSSNKFSQLAGFTNTGGGGVSITDDPDLDVTGAVNAGTGDLTLHTVNGFNIILDANLTAGGTVNLNSTGKITQNAGSVVTAAALTGASVGGASLTQANAVGTLGSFQNTNSGDVAFTDAQNLTVTGPVTNSVGNVALTTTSGGALALAGNVTAGTPGSGNTITLTSGGPISQTPAAVLAADNLTGVSAGGTVLNGPNLVGTLGSFVNTGSGDLGFTNAQSLTVAGPVTDTVGNVVLNVTSGNLTQGVQPITAGGELKVKAAGDVLATTLNAGGDAIVLAGGGATVANSVTAGDDVFVVANGGDAVVRSATLTGTGATSNDPDVAAYNRGGGLRQLFIQASGNATLGADSAAGVSSGNVFTTPSGQAGQVYSEIVANGGSAKVFLNQSGSLGLVWGKAGDANVLVANGTADVGDIKANGNVTLAASLGAVQFGRATATTGSVSIAGQTGVSVQTQSGARPIDESAPGATAGTDISILANTGNVQLGSGLASVSNPVTLFAGRDATVAASAGSVGLDRADAARYASVTASGTATLGTILAGVDASAVSGGNATVSQRIEALGSVTLVSTGGAVWTTKAQAGAGSGPAGDADPLAGFVPPQQAAYTALADAEPSHEVFIKAGRGDARAQDAWSTGNTTVWSVTGNAVVGRDQADSVTAGEERAGDDLMVVANAATGQARLAAATLTPSGSDQASTQFGANFDAAGDGPRVLVQGHDAIIGAMPADVSQARMDKAAAAPTDITGAEHLVLNTSPSAPSGAAVSVLANGGLASVRVTRRSGDPTGVRISSISGGDVFVENVGVDTEVLNAASGDDLYVSSYEGDARLRSATLTRTLDGNHEGLGSNAPDGFNLIVKSTGAGKSAVVGADWAFGPNGQPVYANPGAGTPTYTVSGLDTTAGSTGPDGFIVVSTGGDAVVNLVNGYRIRSLDGANNAFAASSQGAIQAWSVSAGQDAWLGTASASAGDINVDQASAGGDILIHAGRDAMLRAASLSGTTSAQTSPGDAAGIYQLMLSGGRMAVLGRAAGFAPSDPNAIAPVLILSNPQSSASYVEARQGGGGSASVDLNGSVQLTSVYGDQNASVNTTGDLTVSKANAQTSSAAPYSSDGLRYGVVAASGDATVTVGGVASLDRLSAAGNATVASVGKTTLGGGTVAGNTEIRASDLDVTGAFAIKSLAIEARQGGVYLGDGGSASMTLSQSDLDNIKGAGGKAQISIYAGLKPLAAGSPAGLGADANSALGDITVGKLGVDSGQVASLGLYAGNAHRVTVTGALAPKDTAGTVQLAIGDAANASWRPQLIEVINDGSSNASGSIGTGTAAPGAAPSGLRAFRSVSLNAADSILMGSSVFVKTLETTSLTGDQINLTRNIPPVPPNTSRAILLAAGSLTARADKKVLQQNTYGVQSLSGGIFLTGAGVTGPLLTIGRSDAPAGSQRLPDVVDLSLSLNDNGSILSQNVVATSNRISLEVTPSNTYRVNGCVIGVQGNCTPLTNFIVNIQPDRLTEVDLLRRAEDQDVEDPTITGGANEEIWRKPE